MATHIAIDIAGTFTDTAVFDDGSEIERVNTPSEETQLVDGIRDSFNLLGLSLPSVERFANGTTIGLNAVLERDGAKVGLLTNEHFADVLEIGRAQVAFDQRYDVKSRSPSRLSPAVAESASRDASTRTEPSSSPSTRVMSASQ